MNNAASSRRYVSADGGPSVPVLKDRFALLLWMFSHGRVDKHPPVNIFKSACSNHSQFIHLIFDKYNLKIIRKMRGHADVVCWNAGRVCIGLRRFFYKGGG